MLTFLRRSVDEFGQTVVMVTHDAHAASYADRAVFLSDGHIVDEIRGGSQEDLLFAMSRIYPRHDAPPQPTVGLATQPSHLGTEADPIYRDGSPAPAHRGAVDEDDHESTAERSIARRAALEH